MAKTSANPIADSNREFNQKTLRECEAMLNYALSNGKKVKPAALEKLKKLKNDMAAAEASGIADRDSKADNLAEVHSLLAESISPATPATVVLLEDTAKSGPRFLGPVPLVRRMLLVTIICLFVFLGLFGFPEVDASTINGDILNYEGLKFVYNELFIVSAAALGAAFYALFEAYKYIATSSYDSRYDSIYWIRFILGVVAGVILAQFIFSAQPIDPSQLNEATGTTFSMTYKPLLAFLGGFSARVVHKILNSLVDSVETFISGSARDAIRAREEAARTQLQDKVSSIQQENKRKDAAARLQMVVTLMQLQEKMAKGQSSADIQAAFKSVINETIQPVSGQGIYTDVNNNSNSAGADFINNLNNNPVQPITEPNNSTNGNNQPINENVVPPLTDFEIPEHPDNMLGDLNNPNPNNEFKP
jgi:hypothetical protein